MKKKQTTQKQTVRCNAEPTNTHTPKCVNPTPAPKQEDIEFLLLNITDGKIVMYEDSFIFTENRLTEMLSNLSRITSLEFEEPRENVAVFHFQKMLPVYSPIEHIITTTEYTPLDKTQYIDSMLICADANNDIDISDDITPSNEWED